MVPTLFRRLTAPATRITLAMAGLAGLSGCAYTGDPGWGYRQPFAYADYCDSFFAYDAWYDCDYRYGFGAIGFAGGFYDRYWYPGFGIYVFDRPGGRRFLMPDAHRLYWSEQRWRWRNELRRDRREARRDRRTIEQPAPHTRADEAWRDRTRADRFERARPDREELDRSVRRAQRFERRAERRRNRSMMGDAPLQATPRAPGVSPPPPASPPPRMERRVPRVERASPRVGRRSDPDNRNVQPE